MRKIILAIVVLLAAQPADATRYLFYNVYGDASDLTANLPSDIVAVPFGWTPAVEANRSAVLATLGVSVSVLPALIYQRSGKWTELRVFDQTTKPWSWLKTNTAISSNFSVSMVGDSLIAQMAGVQASQVAPFRMAQNLGVSGTNTGSIKGTVASVSAFATHIIIEGGANNYLTSGGENSIIPDYTEMLQAIPAGKLVVAVGIVPLDYSLFNSLRPDLGAKIDNTKISAMNAQIAALCRSYPNCTPAVDVMNMDMVGKTSDGQHLTAAAYPAFVAAIMSAL